MSDIEQSSNIMVQTYMWVMKEVYKILTDRYCKNIKLVLHQDNFTSGNW